MNSATATILGIFYSVPPVPSLPGAIGAKFLGIEKFLVQTCEYFYLEGFKDGAVAMLAAVFVVHLIRYISADFKHIWKN